MRWRGRQGSGNVSDRRGMGGKLAVGGGLGGIVILILSLLLGGNPLETINVGGQENYTPSAAEDERAQFVGVVLR
ncbi:MAG TPA: neutral zinc metallopeptidase, partial [Chryseosolibacter sp.]